MRPLLGHCVLLGLGEKLRPSGLHLGLDLDNLSTDKSATLFLCNAQFLNKTLDPLFISLILLLKLELNPRQALIYGQGLKGCYLLSFKLCGPVINQFAKEFLLEPLAHAGDETCTNQVIGALGLLFGGQSSLLPNQRLILFGRYCLSVGRRNRRCGGRAYESIGG